MPFPVRQQNHEDTIEDFVPLHHRLKPGRKGFVRAIAQFFQRLEDQIYDAYTGNSLDLAKGKALDFYGFFAGVNRGGLSDYWYRNLIKTAFLAKRCRGSVNELIVLWQTAADNPEYSKFTRYKRNLIILTVWRDQLLPANYARRAAKVVAAACPVGNVVLLESPLVYVGSSLITYVPLPSSVTSVAYPAKVWWPLS